MEVRGQQPGGADEARTRFRETQAEIASKTRKRTEEAREALAKLTEERHEAAQERRRAEQIRATERGEQVLDRTEAERKAQDTAQTETSSSRPDRIEISSRALAAHGETKQDDERAARVEALRVAFQGDTLGTPERIELAATRLLNGGDGSADAEVHRNQ